MTLNNPAPGFQNHPNHRIEIHPYDGDLEVTIAGQKITKINGALILEESKYQPAHYITKSALPKQMLEPSDHTTFCPFKGEASYYHLIHDGNIYENAVWSYQTPYDEVYAIKDYLAFYPDVAKVTPIS